IKSLLMAKYKIAWMPGDGVGHDVMEAARLVLDRIKLDAEYVPCDIGWEFWCKEGNALPDRTVKALKETTCGLFGAITSKRQSEDEEVERESRPGKYRALHSHHEQARLHQHLQTSVRVRQENRTQTCHPDREAKCIARNRRLDDEMLPRCREKLPGHSRRRR